MSRFSRDNMAMLSLKKCIFKCVVITQKQKLHNHLPNNCSQKKQNSSGSIFTTFPFIFEYKENLRKNNENWSKKQSHMLQVVAVSKSSFFLQKITKFDLCFYIVIPQIVLEFYNNAWSKIIK